jgi:hypothetical protein
MLDFTFRASSRVSVNRVTKSMTLLQEITCSLQDATLFPFSLMIGDDIYPNPELFD